MPNPPPRRRPTSAGGPSVNRPRPAPVPEPEPAPASDAVLSCTAGPKAGSEFPLDGDEMVVGRATDATISVTDTSVSRKHCAIKREGNSLVLKELESGS